MVELAQKEQRQHFVVAPNPANNEINIYFNKPIMGTATLLNTTGQTVKSVNVQTADGVVLKIR